MSSPTNAQAFFIVYGVRGYQNDVDSAVYDQVYTVDGDLVLHTDLNLNGHSILGLKHRYIIQGVYDKNKDKSKVEFFGNIKYFLAIMNCRIIKWLFYILDVKLNYNPLRILNTVGQASRFQTNTQCQC